MTRSWESVDGTRDGLVRTDRPDPGQRARVLIPGCRDSRVGEWLPDGTVSATATRACTPAPAYREDLPDNADDMFAYLTTSSGGVGNDRQVSARVDELLQQSYLPAATQAALYEALTRVPDAVSRQGARDTDGRAAIAVGWAGAIDSYQLLFDPRSYAYLGWQIVPAVGDAARVRHQALTRTAIVDDVDQLPRPGS